jgi:hypothetical protein
MSTIRPLIIASATAAGLFATIAPASSAPSTDAAPRPAGIGVQVPVYAGPASDAPSLVPADTADAKAAPTVKFNVTYVGFTPAAKAAFQRALNAWASKLSSPVPITVRASWEPLGANILGSAGPSYAWQCNGMLCVDAIANKKAGRNLNPAPDIVARFSSNFSNWHFGTGPAPVGKYDFQSVVMHEIGHGVGFLGFGNVTNGKGTVQLQGFNSPYDRFTRLGSTKTSPLLWKMPNNSAQLGRALTSNNVFFDSAKVRSANAGKAAKLYAPAGFRRGSSYSHLDEKAFPKGNPNSLMTYAIGDGETIRSQGPVSLALLKSIGW